MQAPVKGSVGAAAVTYFSAALLGAALLFGLEPLFVKMALPFFGGAPDVWNVAFAFFTTMLLAGYLYAHALARLTIRLQIVVHAGVLLAAAALLPVHAAPSPILGSTAPALSLLVLLLERIGLPFLALSATAPLVQSWFSLTTFSRDPYRLYVASNVGSFVALLAYPFVVEPFTGLALQSRLWAIGYGVFAVAILACGLVAVRSATSPPERGVVLRAAPRPLADAPRLRATWVVLAAVPAVLMLGLTSHLTVEVASLPFVWTAPLALFLLAYAVAFSGLNWRPLLTLTPYFVLPVVVLLTVHEKLAALEYVALSLAALFFLTLGVGGWLADERPPPEHLTGFYLWVAVGGALGAMLAAFVAPLIFPSVSEYPLAIVLSCLLLPSGTSESGAAVLRRVRGATVALALVATVWLLTRFAPIGEGDTQGTLLLWVSLAAGVCLTLFHRRIRFALCIAALLLYGTLLHDPGGPVIGRERNFFGSKQITADPYDYYHFLISGGTVHGIQAVDPAKALEPRAYYSRSGPLGDVFSAGADRFRGRAIAAVGLGIGSVACYREKGQSWTFYEIDPAVVAIARDPRFFTTLASCASDARVVLGDARLSLEREARNFYALIVVDAYDSDQVPTHLLTREAMAVYLHQLASDGVLAFHTSNRHFDLAPVLAALADDAGLTSLERDDEALTQEDVQNAKMPSSWVVMTRRGKMLPNFSADPRWHALSRNGDLPLWTDDYSSLARVLRAESI